jgi:hypothetical protein
LQAGQCLLADADLAFVLFEGRLAFLKLGLRFGELLTEGIEACLFLCGGLAGLLEALFCFGVKRGELIELGLSGLGFAGELIESILCLGGGGGEEIKAGLSFGGFTLELIELCLGLFALGGFGGVAGLDGIQRSLGLTLGGVVAKRDAGGDGGRGFFEPEDGMQRTEGDAVAIPKDLAVHPLVIDEGAGARTAIPHLGGAIGMQNDLAMMPGHLGVIDDDVVVLRPADGEALRTGECHLLSVFKDDGGGGHESVKGGGESENQK